MSRSRSCAAPLLLLVLALASSACTTFEGQYLGGMRDGQCAAGMPILVEKPRWLKLTYKTVIYGEKLAPQRTVLKNKPGFLDGTVMIQEMGLRPSGSEQVIDHEILSVKEAFSVDPKRPLSGTITYGIDFQEGRKYPTKLTSNVVDTSVEDVVGLIKSVKEIVDPKKPDEDDVEDAGTASARRGEPQVRGTGQRVKIGESIDKVEYYDLWDLDASGFPRRVKIMELPDLQVGPEGRPVLEDPGIVEALPPPAVRRR